MEKIIITDKPLRRIEITGKPLRRIEPEEFAAALGAEQHGERHEHLDLISLGELGSKLITRLRQREV